MGHVRCRCDTTRYGSGLVLHHLRSFLASLLFNLWLKASTRLKTRPGPPNNIFPALPSPLRLNNSGRSPSGFGGGPLAQDAWTRSRFFLASSYHKSSHKVRPSVLAQITTLTFAAGYRILKFSSSSLSVCISMVIPGPPPLETPGTLAVLKFCFSSGSISLLGHLTLPLVTHLMMREDTFELYFESFDSCNLASGMKSEGPERRRTSAAWPQSGSGNGTGAERMCNERMLCRADPDMDRGSLIL
ncbi:hypothetical protein B0H13DRAFT_1888015 [Mycena leptocephala]|nr:hypothetical protein B0H13DRAFT_1888015 [Mycena leptocephala]